MVGWAVDEQPTVATVVVPFTQIHANHAASILAVVHALRGPRIDAEAVVQEAFLRAHGRWDVVGAMDRPELWIQRVALNLATSQLRRLAAEARALARLAARGEVASGPDTLGDDAFWRAVKRLPPQRARVVALRYAGDLPLTDIAAVLGMAEGTVKAHLHQAKAQLATWLTADDAREVDA